MIKAVLSPLCLGLVILLIAHGLLLRQWRSLSRLGRAALVLGCAATLAMTGLSLRGVAVALTRSLERAYCNGTVTLPDPAPLGVVLAGGFRKGTTAERDLLGYDSTMRVVAAVELFRSGRVERLVFAGASAEGPRERESQLMRELAVRLGVPDARVELETASRNTREHAVALAALRGVDRGAPLTVVSSPWHLSRVLPEMRRYFPKAVGVPAYCTEREAAPTAWVPTSSGLGTSTTMLQEYLGRTWARIRRGTPD